MKKKLLLAAMTFLTTTALVACGSAPTTSSNSEGNEIGDTVKIGLNFELTGGVAAYGVPQKNAAELAVEEINAAGGIDGKQIELVSKDNKSENSEAASVTTNLATESKVNAIVGPATSGATAAASPNATSAGVPIVTPSGTQDSLTVNEDGSVQEYVFRATFIDSYQGDVISKFTTDNLNADKVVLYYDNSSDYAKGIAKEFKNTYKGEIVKELTFQSKDTDYQAALTEIKDLDFDAIVMPGYYNETGLLTKQARDLGISQPIVGPDGFGDEKFVELAGNAATTDVYYLSGFSSEISDSAASFIEKYKEKYGEEPSMFAALAYDAVYMVAKSAEGAKTSKEIAENLAKLSDFEGVTGSISIDENHNPVKSVVMIGLKDGKEDSATIVSAE
ncbi:ABC transporter substrate-binding protein [Streptococcus pacificus]|uniref:ABC transporter substrate-binding protein n=1 Tax=Streptococcus pacificus TaxID=2740577 RepID=A0ABS0ZGT1_9STRE|nr:ABC transporter substrate-binding protein [Streptococcus pacificus]MBJ8325222.1 ABC transporter substrate-binding protein [Streptococcus pacificus]